jgi:hypothetical protein
MKLVKPLLALILVIVLGAGVYHYVYKPDAEKKLLQAKEQFLVRFDVKNITSFTIGRPDSAIQIEKGVGSLWNIISPIKAEAENEEITSLFRQLSDTKILFIVEEKPHDLGNYGLDNPQYYLGMKYLNGKSDTLFTGIDTPDGTMTYVKFASEKRVLTVDRTIVDFMKKQTRSYRSRTLLNALIDDITGLELMRGDTDVITLVKSGEQWIMTQPWEFPASTENIALLLKTITETNKKHFIAEHTDSLSKYGLDNPQIILKVTLNKGMMDKLLLIGNTLKENVGTNLFSYAKQFDQDVIFTIEKKTVVEFQHPPIWFIDQLPLDLNREQVNKIVVQTGGREITIIRDVQRQWISITPVDKNLEERIVAGLFGISCFLVVNDVFAYTPTENDVVKSGLNTPQAKLTFYQNDTVLAVVEFGKTYTEKQPITYCRLSPRPVIFMTKNEITPPLNELLSTLFEK